MRDFYKKLMQMSVKDAQEIARKQEIQAVDVSTNCALTLVSTRLV